MYSHNEINSMFMDLGWRQKLIGGRLAGSHALTFGCYHAGVCSDDKAVTFPQCNSHPQEAVRIWHTAGGRDCAGIEEAGIGLDMGVLVVRLEFRRWPFAVSCTEIGSKARRSEMVPAHIGKGNLQRNRRGS